MPALVASYFVESAQSAGDNTSLSTISFTPANGEVLVVKAATWDTGTPAGTPSGGGQTYTRRSTAAPGGFNGYGTIFTATVAGSPGAMSVTLSAPASGCYHSMVVERWSGALINSPPVSSPINGSGTPSATITTTAPNSIVTWLSIDENSRDPATRAYLSGATEDGFADGHLSVSSVQYFAYQTAAVAGSQTLGLSAPASQQWTITGIEILNAPTVTHGAFLPFFQ